LLPEFKIRTRHPPRGLHGDERIGQRR